MQTQLRYRDAHLHWQDARLSELRSRFGDIAKSQNITHSVVNGTSEEDWEHVSQMAFEHSQRVIPSFGLHPWFAKERTGDWKAILEGKVAAHLGRVGIGEIGLDRWIRGFDFEDQLSVFRYQLGLAAEGNLPVSIHCLKAWGPLLEELRKASLPKRGFLLHSYSGAAELLPELIDLGGYFSLSGYFGLDRKKNQLNVFRRIPLERLLLETDAPDMLLPDDLNKHPIRDGEGKVINHPANICAVYQLAAGLLGISLEVLAGRIAENFDTFFL